MTSGRPPGQNLPVRALVQRVSRARVTVGGEEVGRIGAGLCVLIGVTHGDDDATARKLAEKVWHLRILADERGVMNRSLSETPDPEVLCVSQFTLYADTSRGRRPSWAAAAPGAQAEPLTDAFAGHLRHLGATVATGRFGADMQVELVNDGPVTVLIDA
jgi:D-aminoacyl-tRNA deacylase